MLKEVLDIIQLLEGQVTGNDVAAFLTQNGADDVQVKRVEGAQGHTDFVHLSIAGTHGRKKGGAVPTLGFVGRLGGIGARPAITGMVSDADGCIAVLAAALRLLRMRAHGDMLPGDVSISTHICPNAPTIHHIPVPFMGSPVDIDTMNEMEVSRDMEAIISVDTTKGNRILNSRGIAITPTVKEGYILPVSAKLLDLAGYVSGELPRVIALSQYDITPYGNDLHHINSILQAACATDAPVIGLAITATSVIPGCATGANQENDIRDAAMFCVEAAKVIDEKLDLFYCEEEFQRATALYGSLKHFQTKGGE